jgi:hypothetical protein
METSLGEVVIRLVGMRRTSAFTLRMNLTTMAIVLLHDAGWLGYMSVNGLVYFARFALAVTRQMIQTGILLVLNMNPKTTTKTEGDNITLVRSLRNRHGYGPLLLHNAIRNQCFNNIIALQVCKCTL